MNHELFITYIILFNYTKRVIVGSLLRKYMWYISDASEISHYTESICKSIKAVHSNWRIFAAYQK